MQCLGLIHKEQAYGSEGSQTSNVAEKVVTVLACFNVL